MKNMLPAIQDCFESMLNRDHPDAEQRNGLMGLDSSRTQGGAEITTYDSLDVSLGQSRNNITIWRVNVGRSMLHWRSCSQRSWPICPIKLGFKRIAALPVLLHS